MPNTDIYNKIQTNYKCLYGSFHGHSSFSIGTGNPSECYNYAYHNHLDFLFLPEHSGFLSKDKWIKGLEQANKFNKKREEFISLFGFEGKTSFLNDLNIINSTTYFNGCINDLRVLPIWMISNPNAFITISNPLKTLTTLNYNPVLDKIITSIEVTSGSNTRYLRREKFYFALLDKGYKLGAINGLNESKLNFGDSENLTCVIVPKVSKENLIASIRNYQTFSTDSKSLKFFYFINETFMGGTLINTNTLKFTIILEDKIYNIDKLEIISNNGTVIHSLNDIGLKKIKYLYTHIKTKTESWYLVKIYLENNKQALSSPIFLSV